MADETVVAQKPISAAKLEKIRRTAGGYFTRLTVPLLVKTSVTPDVISWLGLLLTIGAGALIISGQLFAGGLAVIVAGLFDTLDGALARATQRVTKFGAILDSTLDRLSEAVLLLSLLPVYAGQQSIIGIVITGLALIGSFMVSYIRARAEGAGLECGVGIFTRPERVVVLALGLLLGQIDLTFLTVALGIIAVFGFISAGQRLYHAWRESQK